MAWLEFQKEQSGWSPNSSPKRSETTVKIDDDDQNGLDDVSQAVWRHDVRRRLETLESEVKSFRRIMNAIVATVMLAVGAALMAKIGLTLK
jgi:hypothetical protein